MIKERIFHFYEREIHIGLWESILERRITRIKAFDTGTGGKGQVANTEDKTPEGCMKQGGQLGN